MLVCSRWYEHGQTVSLWNLSGIKIYTCSSVVFKYPELRATLSLVICLDISNTQKLYCRVFSFLRLLSSVIPKTVNTTFCFSSRISVAIGPLLRCKFRNKGDWFKISKAGRASFPTALPGELLNVLGEAPHSIAPKERNADIACLLLEAKVPPAAVSYNRLLLCLKKLFLLSSKLITIFFSLPLHLSKTIGCSFPLT